jgi:hypothetical protein
MYDNKRILNRFIYYCCLPPVDSLIAVNNNFTTTNMNLPTDIVLLENDLLVGMYVHPDQPKNNIFFGALGMYIFFNNKNWISIEYKQILDYDLFHKTDDHCYNAMHPFFIMTITDNRIVPLDIKLVRYYNTDGTFVFKEIFRIERFIRWCIWYNNKFTN